MVTPNLLTTDQGKQFESEVFKELVSIIGSNRIRTTAYHPAANGLVEIFHRDIKTAMRCHTEGEE